MPQNSETGRKGFENGYKGADEIGTLLGAARISYRSNEFRWKDNLVVIKTGPSVVVTRAILSRVKSIIYGEWKNNKWNLYEIKPDIFEMLSVRSLSKKHNEKYRHVGQQKIKGSGQYIAF